MARRTARSRFTRPPPRTKMWIGEGVGSTAIAASAVSVIGTLSAGADLLRPFTVLRTRMDASLLTDQNAQTETMFGTLGEIVVTDAASAIGVTAIPDPSVITGNPEADWFLSQPMWQQLRFGSSIGFEQVAGPRYVIDSKAMRKVGPDDDLVLVFSNDTAVGGLLITMGRQLIQLH